MAEFLYQDMICEFWLVSSFQITLRKSVEQLDEKHTIFGQGAQYFFASTPGSPSSIDSVRFRLIRGALPKGSGHPSSEYLFIAPKS